MKKLIYCSILILASVIVYATVLKPKPNNQPKTNAEKLHSAILMYADSFNVPINIAFNVAKLETGYCGPHHKNYNHKQVSSCGAVGAMQIMPKYASYFAGFKVNRQELKDSIELNVFISMKLLSSHYEKYKDWRKVLGAYHTGKPIINWYAKKGTTMNYTDYWYPAPIVPDINEIDTTLIVDTQG
jgi:soluble lytic murein transglycosylase-like protein